MADRTTNIYERFFNSTATMLGTAGFDCRFIDLNPAWRKYLGFSAAEMAGNPFLDFVHPDDREQVAAHHKKILAGEKETVFEVRFISKNGGNKWLYMRCTPDREKRLIYLTASDVTTRKLTEDALRESETALRIIIDKAPMSMAIVSMDGTIEFINKKAEQTFGYAHTDIPNMERWWLQAYPDEKYRKETTERFMGRVHKAFLEKTEVEGYVYYPTCKDGSIKTCSIFGVIAAGKVFVMFDDITARVKAEQAVRESEGNLRRILEQVPISIAIHDMGGKLEFINRKFTQTFGYRPEDIPTAESWMLQAYPEAGYRKRLTTLWAALMDKAVRMTGEIEGGEYKVVAKDGSVRIVYVHGVVTADKKVVSLLDDVTSRVETERALRESETRYRTLVETTGTGFVIIDRIGRVLDANREYVRLSGHRDLKEILGRPITDWTAPNEKARNAAAVRQCATNGYIRNFEVDYVDKSGKITPIEVSATVVKTGGVPQILTLCRDITERRETTLRLRDSENKFRTITEKAVVGVYLIQDDKFLYVNPKLAEMSGYAPDELVGIKGPQDLVAPGDWEKVKENIRRRVDREIDALNYELTGVRKDGSRLEVEVYGAINDYAGKPAIIGTLMDISARRLARKEAEKVNVSLEQRVKERTAELTAANRDLTVEITQRLQTEKAKEKLQEELQQSQKMEAVGRLAGGIAHDFNNILVSISGYAEFLLKTMPEGSPARDDLSEILLEIEKGVSLTRQLLTVSRKQPILLKVVDLNSAAAEAEKMLKRIIGANMHLQSNLSPELDRIMADPGQVSQVIMNLVINARDAMPYGGRIIIETRNAEIDREYPEMRPVPKPGHYVMLSVSDTGTGINPEDMTHLFEPFYTTKEPGKGTGLGLSTVYGIISQARGGISVESEPGKGTTFKIYFPRTLDI